jgi:lysophospholipase L1-like esterase
VAGVTLPTQNVAVNGARVADALFTTPQNTLDAGNRGLYSRVLPSGATQVSAMESQNPKLVSVELGANEVLSQFGIALVGAPPAPLLDPATFAAQYRQLLDRVEATTAKHVLLVSLPTNPFSLAGYRTGAEVAVNAAVLAAGFHVAVQADCGTTNAANLMFIPFKLATVMQAGLAAKAAGQPMIPFTCAAGAPTAVDFTWTPAEQAIVAAVVAQMNATILAETQARGFARFSLDALYGLAAAKPPFIVATLFTSTTPWGPLMSIDGIHPSAAGQTLLAAAAANALNQRYNLGIPAQ